jgi:phosphoglycolate phosphatase
VKSKITILFDLDGTLIDSTDAILESFYHSFKELGFDFKGTSQDIKNEIGYPLDIMYETLGVPKQKIANFVDSYKSHYRKISIQKTFLLPQAKEAVKLAHTFATLAVVTTKTTRYSIPLLEDMGLMKYFDTIIGRQEVTNPKPHPEPILKALENLDLKPNKNIFMIGDTKLDLISAKEANINSVGVLCGYGTKQELEKYTKNISATTLEAVKSIYSLS